MSTKKRPPVLVMIIIVLFLLVGGYYGIRALLISEDNGLMASGTIEAVSITISPEMSGKVVEVLFDEGDDVLAGDVLFRLDDSLYQAQRKVANAALDLANANLEAAQLAYDTTLDAARSEYSISRQMDWLSGSPTEYELPQWYFGQAEEIRSAEAELEDARVMRVEAQADLDQLLSSPEAANFHAVEIRLLDARASYLVAEDVLSVADHSADNSVLLPRAQELMDAARLELEEAQSAYDELRESEVAQDVLLRRSVLAIAQARYDSARDQLLLLHTGEYSPQVSVAWANVEKAMDAVDQAQASLEMVDVQIAKLTVVAPLDGVVLARNIDQGEMVVTGSNAMAIGLLDDLTITVFVPEDRYGALALGQEATVTVDSFPDDTFSALIIHIADQAEFTPRNVQTAEGRSSTVFAITLRFDNADGRLKPGMPADVVFVFSE